MKAAARVTGGTFSGGTSAVVECPLAWDRFDACRSDIEVEQRADGTWVLPTECPGCGATIDVEDENGLRAALIEAATDAIRNYDPSQAELDRSREFTYPPIAEGLFLMRGRR